MPAKKKEPKLRWVKKPRSLLDKIYRANPVELQVWDESKNKYVDVPFVEIK